MQSPQDLLARPKRENGLHSLANITFDPIGNGSGPHSDKRTYQDLARDCLAKHCSQRAADFPELRTTLEHPGHLAKLTRGL
jgi:hypothetical protein